MKSERILCAMNDISDKLIEDAAINNVQALPTSKKIEKPQLMPASRRVFRLGIAVALIACLLGTVVFAASSWLFNGYDPHMNDFWSAVTPTDDNGNSPSKSIYELSFYLPLNEAAPKCIETYYLPQVPTLYKQSFGYAYAGENWDQLSAIVYAWDIPDGEKQGMMFYQESGFDSNQIVFSAKGSPDCVPEMKEAILGGVEGVLIVETIDFDYPHQYFFWSDGEYVFKMRFPIEFTEELMAQIIGNIIKIEDVQKYLVSMTEEEMRNAFE